jgi:hypothetical protein
MAAVDAKLALSGESKIGANAIRGELGAARSAELAALMRSVRAAEGQVRILSRESDALIRAIKLETQTAADVAADLAKSEQIVKAQKATAIADEHVGATAAEETAAVAADGTGAALAKTKFGLPSTTTLLGIGLAAYCIYALTSFLGTNGARLKINNIIKLGSSSINTLLITYTVTGKASGVPSSNPFCLRPGDGLIISGCMTGCTNPIINGIPLKVISTESDTTCTVQTPQMMISAGSSTSSTVCDFGTAVVTSTFSNQFSGTIGDTAGLVLNTIQDVTRDVVSTAANIVTDAINTGTGVANNAFCKTVPFLCKSSTLWLGGGVCLLCFVLIIAFFLLK